MIAGETEVLGENLPQRHFVPPQIPHDQVWFRTPDRSSGKPATNRIIPLSVIINTALHTPIQQALNGEKIVLTSHPSSKTQYKQFTLFKSFFL
jgi:hypothetical protein